MKTTIAIVLLRNAVEYIRQAQTANKKNRPDEEVRCCIGAYVMIAHALEAIINEIGEAAFEEWQWIRLEKTDPTLKWYALSAIVGKQPFDPSKEPLQIIQRLNSIRNRIAHPKVQDLGDDVFVRSKDGRLKRNPDPNYILQHGDSIFVGIGKLLDEFNYKVTMETYNKCIVAINEIRALLKITGLEWIDDMDKYLKRKTKKSA